MQRAYFSRHIPLKILSKKDADVICADIELFNKVKRTAARRLPLQKKTKVVDLRKKENAALRKSLPPSLHVQLKRQFKINDYFANSAVQEANAAIRSAKELKQFNLKRARDEKKAVSRKLASKKRRLKALERVHQSLIRRSKWQVKTDGKRVPKPYTTLFETHQDDVWQILSFHKVVRTYENDYLFEVQYLRPKIKQLKHTISRLTQRLEKLTCRVDRIQKDSSVHICFGSKALFHKRDTVYQKDHKLWLKQFRKRRNYGMTISGRKDAKGGNYVFRYNPKTHDLTYAPQTGEQPIIIPNVVFPYGQEVIDRAVNLSGSHRQAIAWRIEHTHNSLIVKCMVTAVPDADCNTDYSTGCIAMDTNYDNLAVVELDGTGNLLKHYIFPFDIAGTSGQNEQQISLALDKVINLCTKANKPFAMEDLRMKSRVPLYGTKKRNRHISLFAAQKVTTLMESKTYKHHLAIRFVNPAYTSQIGKIKWMRRYGMTIHESAAFAIGRRALGLKEALPKWLNKQLNIHDFQNNTNLWKSAYPITKKITPKQRLEQ